jgi:hypothetical protein
MDSEMWRRMYDEAGSVSELARRLGMHMQTVRKQLVKAGIPIRRSGFRSPRTVPIRRGPEHHNWKGGVHKHSSGYLYEYAPDHPAASSKGYVLQHRLVMERKLGRLLKDYEIVHHINEVKTDNRPENLELTNLSLHMQGHKAGVPRDELGRFLA